MRKSLYIRSRIHAWFVPFFCSLQRNVLICWPPQKLTDEFYRCSRKPVDGNIPGGFQSIAAFPLSVMWLSHLCGVGASPGHFGPHSSALGNFLASDCQKPFQAHPVPFQFQTWAPPFLLVSFSGKWCWEIHGPLEWAVLLDYLCA